MEKLKKIENSKKTDICAFFIFLIVIATLSFFVVLNSGDELWNFTNIFKMSNGYTIYNDLNVIITPLYFYIGKIFFLIFGANFLVYRIFETLIFTFLLFMIYKTFNKFKVSKISSILYTLVICLNIKYIIAGRWKLQYVSSSILFAWNISAFER